MYKWYNCHCFSDLSSISASLLSPILRNSDTESIKSDSDGPVTKRRRLSASSQEMLEQLVHRASPLPLNLSSPRDRGHAHLRGSPAHHTLPTSPLSVQYQNSSGPFTRRQRNLSSRWNNDRQTHPPRSNQHRRRWIIKLYGSHGTPNMWMNNKRDITIVGDKSNSASCVYENTFTSALSGAPKKTPL